MEAWNGLKNLIYLILNLSHRHAVLSRGIHDDCLEVVLVLKESIAKNMRDTKASRTLTKCKEKKFRRFQVDPGT